MAKTVVYKRTQARQTPSAMPDSFYTAFAAGEDVTLPAGVYEITEPFVTTVSGAKLRRGGCQFQYDRTSLPVNWRPFEVASVVRSAHNIPFGRYLWHCTGTIVAATTSVVMVEVPDPPPQPGDEATLVAGVGTGDLLWGYRDKRVVIESFADNGDGTGTLTFTEPVGFDVPVYETEEDLLAVISDNTYPDAVGPWGEPFGDWPPGTENVMPCKNGFGGDHGIILFVGGNRTTNVMVEVPPITFVGSGSPNGGALLWAEGVGDFDFSFNGVDDSPTTVCHLSHCFDGTVTHSGDLTGSASSNNGGQTRPCPTISLWGGGNVHVNWNANVLGEGYVLAQTELYPDGFTGQMLAGKEFSSTDAGYIDLPQPHAILSLYWEAPNAHFTGLTIGIPAYVEAVTQAAHVVWEGWSLPGGLKIGEGPENTYYLRTDRIDFFGLILLGDEFDPAGKVEVEDTLTIPDPGIGSVSVMAPEGLYHEVEFQIIEQAWVIGVNDIHGNDYTDAALDGLQVVHPAPSLSGGEWFTVPPQALGGYALYKGRAGFRFYTSGGGGSTQIRFRCVVVRDLAPGARQDWEVV